MINLKKPIFFEKNRVFRVYSGGKLFSQFYGDDSKDDFYPEEWICSCVPALNKGGKPTDGLSIIKGENITFDILLKENKKELLGDRDSLGILVKTLDSAVRLPIQAHPNKEFSKKYFSSEYGKTEMWLVLATRKNAHIFIGFDHKLTKEEFITAVDKSEAEKNIMVPLLSKIYVTEGDVYLIPSTMVHAIGYGCLILEVQEPTDFTIQPESWCDNYKLSEFEKYIGLDRQIAIDCFDFNITKDIALSLSKKTPKLIKKTTDYSYESLVSYDDTPCFAVNKIIVNNNFPLDNKPAIYIVINGNGELSCSNVNTKLKQGDYFFLPYSSDATTINSTNLTLIECLPPKLSKC